MTIFIYFGWNPRTEKTNKGGSLKILKDCFKKGKEQSFLQIHDREANHFSCTQELFGVDKRKNFQAFFHCERHPV